MAITLAEATSHLATWVAADTAVAKGQAYSIGDRMLTRAHVSEIRTQINYWSRMEATLQRAANSQPRVGVTLANFTSSSNQ